MTEPRVIKTGEQGLPSAALRGLSIRFFIASFGLWMVLLAPVMVSLPLRVGQVDPAHKASSLGLVLAAGAALSLVSGPLFGRLSDGTASRFGRRRPWIIGGVIGGAAGLTVIALVPSIPAITAGWCLTQVSLNATYAALLATIPDQVPPEQRGSVSGAGAAAQPLAIVAGSALPAALAGRSALQLMVPAALALVTIGYFGLTHRDSPAGPGRPPFSVREFVGGFWVNPAAHPDFGWAWLTRFLVLFGQVMPATFLVFFLPARVGVAQHDVAGVAALAILVTYAAAAVVAPIGGWLSDRVGRQKPFVIGSAAVLAVGLALMAFAHSVPAVLAAEAVLGLGSGLFYAVDTALVTLVLPRQESAAKDLGVINIAAYLPGSIAPAVAPLILALGAGQNYQALFLVAALSSVVGAVLVTRIKGAR